MNEQTEREMMNLVNFYIKRMKEYYGHITLNKIIYTTKSLGKRYFKASRYSFKLQELNEHMGFHMDNTEECAAIISMLYLHPEFGYKDIVAPFLDLKNDNLLLGYKTLINSVRRMV